jgi:radical SAM superfamily enzyme YgiQ (UPF0313 family)
MKVTFIFPPAWAPWAPSYAMALLNSLARKRGHDFIGYDLNIDFYNSVTSSDKNLWNDENVVFWFERKRVEELIKTHEEFIDNYIDKIVATRSKLYAFSVQTASSIFASLIAEKIKKRIPDCFILFGGPDCFRSERGLNFFKDPHIDGICVGEGDCFWPEFLNTFEENNYRVAKVEGLVFRNPDGTLNDCGDPIIPTNLDDLPFADYSGASFNKYSLNNRACLMTSRGCINLCSYCSESPNFKKYRYRSAQSLFEEVKGLTELLLKSSGTKPFINFSDSLINGVPQVLREFCELVIADKLELNWGGMAFLRKEMDRDLLKLMKSAGFMEVMWGLESGSNDVLRLMKKNKYSARLAEKIIRNTYELGISQCANFIVGFPGETEQMFLESAMFLFRNKRYFKNFGLPLMEIKKNSAVYARYRDYGIVDREESIYWKTKDGLNDYELRIARRDLLSAILNDKLFDQGRYRSEFSVKTKWHDVCERLSKRLVLSGTNEVIVYGAGEVGRALLAVAPDSGLAIRCLVDRNAALWGQAIEGIPICSLSNAMKLGLHKYLIASFSYIDEIKKQIESCYNGMDTKPLILWERM